MVFHFCAHEHACSHPRWDPDIELWLENNGPIGVGPIFHRRNGGSGTPAEGTMEVVEFEPNRVIGMIIHDSPAEIRGRTPFGNVSDNQTTVTTIIELPGMDESMDNSFLISRLERSGNNIAAFGVRNPGI